MLLRRRGTGFSLWKFSANLCKPTPQNSPNPAGYNHWTVPVKKPSPIALLLALIPFIAMCFSVALWDRIDPTIFGLPFNLAWLLFWIVLGALCMWAAYRVETARNKQDGGAP